jgi:hypothetical protein
MTDPRSDVPPDYSALLAQLRDDECFAAVRLTRIRAAIASVESLIAHPAPSSVQGMIDERARLGKALEDSQADIRAAAREGDAR